MAKRKKSRQKKLSTLKQEAWEAMSRCVRYGESTDGIYANCVSCGTPYPWKEMDGGHWQAKCAGNAVYFIRDNVHAQCKKCNLSDGDAGYALWMIANLGVGRMEQIREAKHKIVKYTRSDYEEMKAYYDNLFEDMQQQRAAGHMGRLEFVGWA